MSPRFEPDFTTVQASTPLYQKGAYELEVTKVLGSAWTKETDKGDYQVKRVRAMAKIRGFYDSKGKLKTDHPEHGKIEGNDVSPIDLYIHSEGAMKMAKRQMMAILGYNPNEPKEEEEYNEWLRSGVDLGFDVEDAEDGEGFVVTLGDGWKTLEGRNVVANLDVEMYQREGEEPRETQRISSLTPVGT